MLSLASIYVVQAARESVSIAHDERTDTSMAAASACNLNKCTRQSDRAHHAEPIIRALALDRSVLHRPAQLWQQCPACRRMGLIIAIHTNL